MQRPSSCMKSNGKFIKGSKKIMTNEKVQIDHSREMTGPTGEGSMNL